MGTQLLCILLLAYGTLSAEYNKTPEFLIPTHDSIYFEHDMDASPIRVIPFPSKITLYEGQDALIRMSQQFNTTSCVVGFMTNQTVVSLHPAEQNPTIPGLQYLDSYECGVRISKVNKSLEGVWNLTVGQNNISVAIAMFSIIVDKSIPDFEMSKELVNVGDNYMLSLALKDVDAMYCSAKHPLWGNLPTLYREECKINLIGVSLADSGLWESFLGVEGMIEEIRYRKELQIEDRNLNAGCENSTTSYPGAMNLFCNIPSIFRATYCRFVRPRDGAGFNMIDGLGNGRYSYYGAGVKANECGLTIESPELVDIGVWQCIIGYEHNYVSSLIPLYLPEHNNCQMKQHQELVHDDEEEDIDAMIGSTIYIMCSTLVTLKYCLISSPNQTYYYGEVVPLGLGKCIVQISPVTEEDNGRWTCYMGDIYGGGEISTTINVRVRSSYLVPVKDNIAAIIGEETSLSCQSMLERKIPVDESSYIKSTRSSLAYCRFIRPDGISILLNETGILVQDRYEYYGKGLTAGDCGITIRYVNLEDGGRWRCISHIQGKDIESWNFINLEINGSNAVFPSSVVVQKGEEVVLRLINQYPNQQSCSVKLPNGTVVDLSSPGSHPVSYWGLGVSKGYCGVRIKGEALEVSSDGYEMWTLISMDNESKISSAVAWVAVTEAMTKSMMKSDNITLSVDLGGSTELHCDRAGSEYCIIVPPGGNREHHAPSSCTKFLDPIISIHLGSWTCYIGLSTTIREVVQTIELVARDTTISPSWKSSSMSSTSVELSCNIEFPLEYCRFIGPGGKAIRLNNGLVTEQYSYAGNGMDLGDCSMTIVEPQEDDYGTWMCFVGVKKDDEIDHQVGYIKISKNKMEQGDFALTQSLDIDEVMAIVGSELTIMCEAKASLTYCWFRHPNGTQFVPVAKEYGDTYYYSGVGLQMGVCGITIAEAQFEDSGLWKCHMGLKNDVMGEIVKKIEVTITRSALHAVNSSIEPKNDNSTVISCLAVPTDKNLAYCRFVRPDGKGFNMNHRMSAGVLDRYYYYGEGLNNGHCGIQILEVHSEDYGQWICAALPSGGGKESIDYITIKKPAVLSNSIIWMIIGTAVIVLLVGTITAVFWLKRRKILHNQNETLPQL